MSFEGKSDQELESRLVAIGRPTAMFGGAGRTSLDRLRAGVDARASWDSQHQELAAECRALTSELERRRSEQMRLRELREEEERMWQRIEASGAGSRNVELLRQGLGPTPALEAVVKFITPGESSTFLLLTGPPGVGKSAAAMRAVKCFAATGQPLFVRAVECSRMGMFDADAKELVARMRRVSFLVIDDLGVEGLNAAWQETLDDVLDHRYQERLTTLLTTNLPPTAPEGKPSFRARYGERIADRIKHDGTIAQCGKRSLRREPLSDAPTPTSEP